LTVVNFDLGQEKRARRPSARRERHKADVRQRLFEGALQLFQRRGYEGTAVQEICARADVAKGTFFNYFASKEHVLVAYHDRLKEGVLARLERRRFRSARAAVHATIAECARAVAAERALGRILLRVMFGSALLLEADARQEQRFLAWLRAHLEAGVARGELSADLDLDLFLSLITAVLSATVVEWVLSEGAPGLEAQLEGRVALLFRGAEPRDKASGSPPTRTKKARRR
jgi:AcrR family transcriptional regulator